MSSKSTTIKRILKEASELSASPSPDYHAAPLDSNLFEWHFTLRGPPAPSPFASGIYHGRITLPPAYPLRPPSFRFLTPSGRFEVNREICLSISGHHEETWQPAWGVRTALVAIRALMDEDAAGQVGGMGASAERRREWAELSRGWKCAGCGRANEEILLEQEGLEGDAKAEEEARELVGRIGFVEPKKEETVEQPQAEVDPGQEQRRVGDGDAVEGLAPRIQEQRQPLQPVQQLRPLEPQRQQPPPTDAWIDKAIVGLVLALVFMVLRRYV